MNFFEFVASERQRLQRFQCAKLRETGARQLVVAKLESCEVLQRGEVRERSQRAFVEREREEIREFFELLLKLWGQGAELESVERELFEVFRRNSFDLGGDLEKDGGEREGHFLGFGGFF